MSESKVQESTDVGGYSMSEMAVVKVEIEVDPLELQEMAEYYTGEYAKTDVDSDMTSFSEQTPCGPLHAPYATSAGQPTDKTIIADYTDGVTRMFGDGLNTSARHTDISNLLCQYCNTQCIGDEEFSEHINKAHGVIEKHECTVCNKKFDRSKSLQAHLKHHSEEALKKLSLYTDGVDPNDIREHIIEQTPHECANCERKFSQKEDLFLHARIHTGEMLYECSFCNKQFYNKNNYSQHMSTHTGEKPFGCSLCVKKFTLRSTLAQHMRIHTGETPYVCSICGSRFTLKSTLSQHFRTHTGETPYVCEICNKRFTQKSNLSRHVRLHTGETPYECSICNKKFSQKIHVYSHMRIHTGGTFHDCTVCDKKFTRKSSLSVHMRIHTGEIPPFECSVCNKRFSVRSTFTVHLRTHDEQHLNTT